MARYLNTIFPTAQVHHTALLGDNSVVWHFANILEGAEIGKDVVIGSSCFLGRRCRIGEGSRLHPGACIPDNAIIGSHVFVGANVVLTDVAIPNLHDKSLEQHCPPTIEDDVVLGSNAVILPGVIVHKGAIVGAGAVVTRDVPAGCTVVGNPARVVRRPVWDAPAVNEAGEIVTHG